MNKRKFTENSKEEMPISSQVTLNDNNWEIIKKFRIVDIDNDKIKYTFLARCKKCGFEKEVSNSGIYKGLIWCPQCSALEEIGKIYGNYKILEFVDRSTKDRSYKVQCLKCGHIFEKKRLGDIRRATDHCQFCNIMEENPGINKVYTTYKTGAKKRGLQFNLDQNQFLSIVQKDCAYCGQPPKYRDIKLSNKTVSVCINGIDRIDSSKDYSYENCVPCCSMCNTMKLHYSVDEFKNHVSKIYHFLVKGSTTIPKGSTSEAPDGNGEIPPNNLGM